MTLLMSDTFTGTNGAALGAGWTNGYTGTGASTAIQSNKGRWTTGTGTGYAGTKRVSRRVVVTNPVDAEIAGTYTPNGESYPEIYVRCSDTVFDTGNGYALRLPTQGGASSATIYKYVSFASTNLGSAAFSATNGTTYGFRFQVVGNTLKARIWSGSEPATWNITVTDSTFTSAGNIGFSVGPGNAANTTVDFDDVFVYDGPTSNTVSLSETFQAADAISVQASIPVAETVAVTDAMTVAQLLPAMTETLTVTDAMSVQVFQLRHDLKTEIQFTDGEWTDVTEWVKGDQESAGTFGRPTRYDDIAASTWTTTLDNRDGRFTPGNPNSPYFPNVVKGRPLRTSVVYAGQAYPRFWGEVTSLTMPSFTDATNCVVRVQAADVMARLARKTLASPFVEESRRAARQDDGGGCDVFPFPPSTVVSDGSVQAAPTSFENKGILAPGSTTLGSISVMSAGNGAGVVKSASPDADGGVLAEGVLDFEVGDNGEGKQAHPILVCKPQPGFQVMELFFKIPENVLPPRYKTGTYTIVSGDNWNNVPGKVGMTQSDLALLNPSKYPSALAIGDTLDVSNSTTDSEWVLANLWAGSTEVLRIVLGNADGKLALAYKKPDGSAGYIYGGSGGADNLADGKWRKLTIYKNGSSSAFANINDLAAGGGVTSLPADLTAVTTVYLGGRHNPATVAGRQVQCPPVSLTGVAFQRTNRSVPYWYALGAPPANVTAYQRFIEIMQYAHPIDVPFGVAAHPSLETPFEVKVVRTATTGRSVTDCLQELARTVGAYLWVQPEDGVLTMRKGPIPPTTIATVDLEGDADEQSPPEWRDSVDTQPTRVTAKCPAGEVTSVNSAAEALGQYRDMTVETCARSVAAAKGVADLMLAGQATLALSNLQVDLVHAQDGALWTKLLPVFLPTEQAFHITSVPAQVFGFSEGDATIESWTEAYTIDSARFTFETSPTLSAAAIPVLSNFTTTATETTSTTGTVTAPQPAGTTTGDLLLAIMTTDETGSVAGMSPPDGTWTAQGTGGSSNAGYGHVWTKTAGASEPTAYDFKAQGSTGSAVLMADDFTGTTGAGFDSGKWVAGETRTGASRTIQGNTGRLNPGTNTGYTGRVSANANITDRADVELLLSFRMANNDTFPAFVIRGDSGGLLQSGYEFRPGLSSTQGSRLASLASFTSTTLGWIPGALTAGTWYRVRFQAIGSTVRVRMWTAGSTEPGSWGVSVTNTAITAAGKVTVVASGGNAAGSNVDLDDVQVSNPTAVVSYPQAKVTLVRVAGADTTSPLIVAPQWQADAAATTSHVASSASPTEFGMYLAHWHIQTDGT